MPQEKNKVRRESAHLAHVILDSVGVGGWRREKYDLAAKAIDAVIDVHITEDRLRRAEPVADKSDSKTSDILERCAKVADEYGDLAWGIYKGAIPEKDGLHQADAYTEGVSEGAHAVARILRAHKETA